MKLVNSQYLGTKYFFIWDIFCRIVFFSAHSRYLVDIFTSTYVRTIGFQLSLPLLVSQQGRGQCSFLDFCFLIQGMIRIRKKEILFMRRAVYHWFCCSVHKILYQRGFGGGVCYDKLRTVNIKHKRVQGRFTV